MKYIIGLFISVVGFVLASQHLHQGIMAYWDFVAFAVVILGTFAIMLITFPAAPMKLLFQRFARKFLFSSPSLSKHVDRCLEVYQTRKFNGQPQNIEDTLLKDGLEMLALGFSTDRIDEVLSRRFETYSKRINMLSAWFKRGAKYPPAFGLAGTVLGLIHLMRGISEGIDTKETGIRMAVALVATFYGLLISNLMLSPIGEWLQEDIKRDEMKAEASLQLIHLLATGANVVEASETMNSFLSQGERSSVNLLAPMNGGEEAA
jgi:chemotaxis protein MotA